jgi:DNA polymerase-3 subunit chi
MSLVDFHILDNNENLALLRYACRLIRKAYKNNFKVYVRTENDQDMIQLDTLLWTFSELDFIPHATVETESGQEPVIIGMIDRQGDSKTILINLSTKMAEDYSSYSRVFELIGNDPNVKTAGRDRYRRYRKMNDQVNNHHIAVD